MNGPLLLPVLDAGGTQQGNPYTNPVSWKHQVIAQARTGRPELLGRHLKHYEPILAEMKARNSGMRAIAQDVEAEFRRRMPWGSLVELAREGGDV